MFDNKDTNKPKAFIDKFEEFKEFILIRKTVKLIIIAKLIA